MGATHGVDIPFTLGNAINRFAGRSHVSERGTNAAPVAPLDRVVLFLNTVLLMDIAFLPFAASVLAQAFHDGQGQRTAVVLHGLAFELAAVLFNSIWEYARHDGRLLAATIDTAGARAISRRFRLALAWIATGVLLGAWLPVLGVAVIAAFIPFYWLPIAGEVAKAKRRRDGGGHA